MPIPVIDFSKLNGEERAKTMAEIAVGCEEWGFFQLVNHGLPVELLERVKKVTSECYKLEREEEFFKNSTPVKLETMKGNIRAALTKKLSEKLMEVMDENLGIPKGYIKKAFNGGEGDKAFFGTKVSHYPPCSHPEMVNGLRAHTDAGGVILLFQDDEVGGLEILKDGEWTDVQPIPNAICINTGDQIEVLSNGKYKSVWHRFRLCLMDWEINSLVL
ncbi:1-aminocyclopropane-1-carboxylate oxidase 5-like protein [Tanacetum coccineum]